MRNQLQLIIGIGGVSQSGKSTLAEKLATYFDSIKIRTAIINQDDYVYPKDQLPIKNGLTDWERPETIDWNRLQKAIIETKKGHQIIIIEGLFAFNDKKINELMTHFLYLEIVKETFLARKNQDTRWALPPEWYIDYIWDAHGKFAEIPGNVQRIDSNKNVTIESALSLLDLRLSD